MLSQVSGVQEEENKMLAPASLLLLRAIWYLKNDPKIFLTFTRSADIECRYDGAKLKPGLRTGAVENINQRLGMYGYLDPFSFTYSNRAPPRHLVFQYTLVAWIAALSRLVRN